MIRSIDTRRIIDCVRINAASAQAVFDPRFLRETQICAFANNTSAQVGGVHSYVVIASVTDLFMFFSAGLYVGTNTP